MIRSLRTGVTGLKTHQARMDVVGNNIANVNTLAYKRNRAVFNEVLGQQLLGLSRTGGSSGITTGVVGYGVAVGAVNQNWTQGPLEFTNIQSDLALNGDGFFVVSSGDRSLLTRAGNFIFNSNGKLMTSDGLAVQAYAVDDMGNTDTSTLTDIDLDFSVQEPPQSTTDVVLANNVSSDLAVGEFYDTQTGVFDEQGRQHTMNVRFTKDAENQWSYDITYTGTESPPPFADTSGTLAFNVDGTLVDNSPITVDWDSNYVGVDPSFDVDITGITQFARVTTVNVVDRNGNGSGQLEGYSIDAEGFLFLNFSNGERRPAFQLVVGNVNNPNALENVGENLFAKSPGSGDIQLRTSPQSSTAIVSGALELSNTDLATEFTDMIVAQRGYQASARVISTSDEMLQEVVQLKR